MRPPTKDDRLPSLPTDDNQDAKARLADYIANRPWSQGPEGMKVRFALRRLVLVGSIAVVVLVVGAKGFGAPDRRINYAGVPGRVTAVTTACRLVYVGSRSFSGVAMPCDRAYADQHRPGLFMRRVHAVSTLSYSYVVAGKAYTAQARESVDIPRVGEAITVLVNRRDPAVSIYDGVAD